MININLADYFDTDQSIIDKQDRSYLSLRKLSHKIKFINKLTEEIKIADLLRIMDLYCNTEASNEMLDKINRTITRVLDRARQSAQDSKRAVPYSNEKDKRQTILMY